VDDATKRLCGAAVLVLYLFVAWLQRSSERRREQRRHARLDRVHEGIREDIRVRTERLMLRAENKRKAG